MTPNTINMITPRTIPMVILLVLGRTAAITGRTAVVTGVPCDEVLISCEEEVGGLVVLSEKT